MQFLVLLVHQKAQLALFWCDTGIFFQKHLTLHSPCFYSLNIVSKFGSFHYHVNLSYILLSSQFHFVSDLKDSMGLNAMTCISLIHSEAIRYRAEEDTRYAFLCFLTFRFTQVSLAALLYYFAILSFAGKNISFECSLFPQNRRSFCALNKGLI